MKKTYTRDEVLQKYQLLNANDRAKILWNALDYMNQYNGRSRYDCVELAMRATYSLAEAD